MIEPGFARTDYRTCLYTLVNDFLGCVVGLTRSGGLTPPSAGGIKPPLRVRPTYYPWLRELDSNKHCPSQSRESYPLNDLAMVLEPRLERG